MNDAKAIRVFLVDDQTLVRQGIRSLLALADDIEVVAEASDGRQAVEQIPQVQPDVVLVLQPGTAQPFGLFCRPRDPEREIWDGRRAGVEKLRAIIGGFHLAENATAEQLAGTIAYFKRQPNLELYPCHCTCFAARAKMFASLPVHEVGVGMRRAPVGSALAMGQDSVGAATMS